MVTGELITNGSAETQATRELRATTQTEGVQCALILAGLTATWRQQRDPRVKDLHELVSTLL